MKNNILIVDDNVGVLSALKLVLSRDFDNIITLSSPKTLISTLRQNEIDVVLLDMNFLEKANTGNEGLFWLSEIKRYFSCEVVLFTAYGDIELAVNGIKRGAFDFIVKPWDNEKLRQTLLDAAKLAKSKSKTKEHTNILPVDDIEMFWGETDKMQQLHLLLRKTASSDANVLITGENGTGKDLLAKEIHLNSKRSKNIFLPVDMGSISETLFESELFGHVKGAFTDAKSDHEGKFETANNGTLFLDEIGNIPINLQSKLLRVLQDRTITRVGDNKPIPIDIRLVCATNMNLIQMLHQGKFREDLYYRINTIHLHLPPLRERKEDIVPLAKIFMQHFANQYNKNIVDISDEAKDLLINNQWGGNIRELKNCIEKAVVLSETSILQLSDIQSNFLNHWLPEHIEYSYEENTLEEIEKKNHNKYDEKV